MPSLGQKEVKQALSGDTISRLRAMSKDELMTITGMTKRYEALVEHLAEADALTGKARETMNNKLDERLAPKVDGYDLEWMIKDAKRSASNKKGGATAPCC